MKTAGKIVPFGIGTVILCYLNIKYGTVPMLLAAVYSICLSLSSLFDD